MKRGVVICSTTNGPVEAPGLVGSYLAAHRSLAAGVYNPHLARDWTVTHIASGFAVYWFDTQRECRSYVEFTEREHRDDWERLAKLKFGTAAPERGKGAAASKRLFEARQRFVELRLAA